MLEDTRSTPYRLLALDIDGTVMRVDGFISPTVEAAIRRARQTGLEVTFATGRRFTGFVQETAQRLGLQAPLVTLNGSEVWLPDGRLLARHTLDPEDARFLFDLARELRARFWAVNTDHEVHDDTTCPEGPGSSAWLKFGFWSSDEAVIRGLWERLKERGGLELTNSHPNNIEVNPPGINKAAGLTIVCDTLGLRPEQVIAVGDSLNDVAMIRWAGLGVAMGNAQDAVKASARFITESVDEDGVAVLIDHVLTSTA